MAPQPKDEKGMVGIPAMVAAVGAVAVAVVGAAAASQAESSAGTEHPSGGLWKNRNWKNKNMSSPKRCVFCSKIQQLRKRHHQTRGSEIFDLKMTIT